MITSKANKLIKNNYGTIKVFCEETGFTRHDVRVMTNYKLICFLARLDKNKDLANGFIDFREGLM